MIQDTDTMTILHQTIKNQETLIKDQNRMLLEYGVKLTECKEEYNDWSIKAHQTSFIDGLEWGLKVVNVGGGSESAAAKLITAKISEIESEL